jgi:hypothetical protein
MATLVLRTIKLTFVFLFLHLAIAHAQTTTGNLVGIVSDPSGASLPGVSVVAIEQDTNRRRDTVTGESGNYSITDLPAAIYDVHFQLAGFRGVEVQNVTIRVNEISRRNVSMEVGQLEQKLIIEADGIGLQTDNSSIGATIRQDQLDQQLLNGRQLERLALLFPGMVTAAPNSHLSNRSGFNSVGLDEHYFSFFVDGIDNNDPVIRNFSYRPVIDGVREIKVEESGYNAEFGRNGGAVISVNTRAGSNAFHGSFWEFWRNDNLDARNFFVPSYVDKPATLRNQFGLALSGPLKQDRTFFSIVAEGLLQKTGQARRATVPTDRMRIGDLSEIGGPIIPESQIHPVSREVFDAYPRADLPGVAGNRTEIANKIENGYDISIRLDHQLSARNYLMGRFSTNTTRVIDPFRTETSGVSNLSGFGQTADRFRTNLGLTLTTVIGDNMVNVARVGYNRFRQPQIPMNRGTPAQVPLMGYVKAFLVYDFGTVDRIGSNAEFDRTVNVYNYMDSLSFTRGKHQLKVGVDARRYLVNAYNVGPNFFNFSGLRTGARTAGNAMADFLLGLPTVSLYFDGEPTGNTRKFEFAGYFQDDWKITPRLTLNYGVRWEYYGRITERVNKQSFWTPDCNCMRLAGVDASEGLVDNDLNNFAPRLGFAWRPVDDDTVIRASGGIFYDNDMRHNLEFATNPPFFFTREYPFPPSLSDPFPPSMSSSTLRPNTYDKKFRDTYVEHWNLSVQRRIGPNLFAEAAYVGNHSVKARRLRNVNQPINGGMPYPGFGPINLFEQAGSSNYNALQVRVERPALGILGFTFAYTWGHAIDDRPGQGAAFVPDNYNMRAERGDADFDVRHNWTSSARVNVPWGTGEWWGGWSMNAIWTLQGGRPFTVLLNPFTGARPDSVPGVDWRHEDQGPDHWINPAAFSVPAGTSGNLGRNTVRGPGLRNLDLSLVKAQSIGEGRLELRVEFFNIFNHPNFSLPNPVMGPTLGLISSTSSPERQIQLGAKFSF